MTPEEFTDWLIKTLAWEDRVIQVSRIDTVAGTYSIGVEIAQRRFILDIEPVDADQDDPIRKMLRHPNASDIIGKWLRHELTIDEVREALSGGGLDVRP
jgi:hypothetical protein